VIPGLDLTEAIEATARALYGDIRSDAALTAACGLVRPYVETYTPIIARQVAEKIAKQIEARRDQLIADDGKDDRYVPMPYVGALNAAAEIAREVAR
jgi:hypothetical protein